VIHAVRPEHSRSTPPSQFPCESLHSFDGREQTQENGSVNLVGDQR
jgi:hypothetical protein